MSNTFNIERSILASVLNSEQDIELNKQFFTDEFHRKLVDGINRLKQLGEYIDFETLRYKFMKVNKWSLSEDQQILSIMCNTTPFSTKEIITTYYDILKKEYFDNSDMRFSI